MWRGYHCPKEEMKFIGSPQRQCKRRVSAESGHCYPTLGSWLLTSSDSLSHAHLGLVSLAARDDEQCPSPPPNQGLLDCSAEMHNWNLLALWYQHILNRQGTRGNFLITSTIKALKRWREGTTRGSVCSQDGARTPWEWAGSHFAALSWEASVDDDQHGCSTKREARLSSDCFLPACRSHSSKCLNANPKYKENIRASPKMLRGSAADIVRGTK